MSERPLIDLRGQSPLPSMFNVRDTRSYPETFDMSTIQPTLDMAMGGYKDMHTYSRWSGKMVVGLGIGGLQTKFYPIANYGQAVGGDPQIIIPINHCFVLFGLSLKITFDAAGSGAIGGVYFSQELHLYNAVAFGDPTHFYKPWRGTYLGNASLRGYFDGSLTTEIITLKHLRVIPAGCSLGFQTYTQNGSLFPANTIVDWSIAGINVPIGEPLPSL